MGNVVVVVVVVVKTTHVIGAGFVQYIESVSVREVSDTEGSILNFFRKYHPSDSGPYGIAADVMDSYIRSCGNPHFTSTH